MDVNKSYRLAELSKKFNLSIIKIVEILKKSNIIIEVNPNSKLTQKHVNIIETYLKNTFKEKFKTQNTNNHAVTFGNNNENFNTDFERKARNDVKKDNENQFFKVLETLNIDSYKNGINKNESDKNKKGPEIKYRNNNDYNVYKKNTEDKKQSTDAPNNNTNPQQKTNKKKYNPSLFINQRIVKSAKEIKNNYKIYLKEKQERLCKKREKILRKNMQNEKQINISGIISVHDLSILINVDSNTLIKKCKELGIKATENQALDKEIITLLAEEFNFNVTFVDDSIENFYEKNIENKIQEKRDPVVAVMGHVDHGKTSLLDYIRKTNVTKKEFGGITQHIGAYKTEINKENKITFLDTPGHEAFTAMRARGCKITDIVIIIIAADDGIKPQTKEALIQAKNSDTHIIFAINKMDKEEAKPEKIKEELAQMNFVVEDWGGKYQCQYISAKTGEGINDLLEKILLETEMLNLKASFKGKAKGVILESSLDKNKGYINNILVQNGELNVGDVLISGKFFGKVKQMINDNGESIKKAYPSDPVQILGMNGASKPGEVFYVVESEKDAKNFIAEKERIEKEQKINLQIKNTVKEEDKNTENEKKKSVNIIIKSDVDGSSQALADSLIQLNDDEINVKIVHRNVGIVTESDILLASSTKSVIISFNLKITNSINKLAEKEKVSLYQFSIIYEAIDLVKELVKILKNDKIVEKYVGKAEIKAIFDISKVGKIAGCVVLEGPISKKNKIKIIRGNQIIFEGEIKTLKHQKTEIETVKTNGECGICIKKYENFNVGDIIEFYEVQQNK